MQVYFPIEAAGHLMSSFGERANGQRHTVHGTGWNKKAVAGKTF